MDPRPGAPVDTQLGVPEESGCRGSGVILSPECRADVWLGVMWVQSAVHSTSESEEECCRAVTHLGVTLAS